MFDLRKWRKKRGIGVIEFAKMICVHRDTIRRIENGECFKNLCLIQSFCELYDIKNARK